MVKLTSTVKLTGRSTDRIKPFPQGNTGGLQDVRGRGQRTRRD